MNGNILSRSLSVKGMMSKTGQQLVDNMIFEAKNYRFDVCLFRLCFKVENVSTQ